MGGSRVYNRAEKLAPFEGYGGRIVEHSLDADRALDWASQRLPARLLELLDPSQGDWSAPLPEGVPPERAHGFDAGVLPEPPTSKWKPFESSSVSAEFAERIASSLGCSVSELVVVPKASLVLMPAQSIVEHLASAADAIALVREMTSAAEADCVQWSSTVGVFYPLAGTAWNRESVADLMDFAASSSGEFALLTSCSGADPSSSADISDAILDALVVQAASILVGAYDGEGYLRWTRRAPSNTGIEPTA